MFAGARTASAIAQEEIFGPVALVLPFDDADEAVAIANDSATGSRPTCGRRISPRRNGSRAAPRGRVWINGGAPPDARLPWGGLKTSGIGRELGWAGIEANTEEKTVTITF